VALLALVDLRETDEGLSGGRSGRLQYEMRIVASSHTQRRLAPVNLESVRRIADRFPEAGLRETAVVRAYALDRSADPSGRTRVWLALETLQITGSFKVRGALVALERILQAEGPGGRVVAANAGNHGRGIAYAARLFGLAATLVVPANVSRAMRVKMEREGIAVIVSESDDFDDAEAQAEALAEETGTPFVSAYDHPDVVSGNGGSLGFEIVRAMAGVPDLVIVPFGRGGLATGLAHALAAEADECKATRCVWGVQSEAAAAMALSLERGGAVERLPTTRPTLARGLVGGISGGGFERAREAIEGLVVVRESQIARAMNHAYLEMGLVLEGSAATALVPVLEGLPTPLLEQGIAGGAALRRGTDLVVVLTGRNVDPGDGLPIRRDGEREETRRDLDAVWSSRTGGRA
jgi:threonine dehydratase